MVDRAIFHMWRPIRDSLIEGHQFFVAEAKKRLLDQFNEAGMEADAERYSNDWLARKGLHFDPDWDDEGSIYEQANSENVNYYLRLKELWDTTRLSIVASMYHEWEKQFRRWCATEIGRFSADEGVQQAIWRQPIERLLDLFECCKWLIRSQPYYRDLCHCQLVVNVYKHGAGTSFDSLRRIAPKFVRPSFNVPPHVFLEPDYTYLKITDADLDRFSTAITDFWRDVPENILESQIENEPAWFRRAFARGAGPQSGTKLV
ncbi:hypothetical protein [Muricoccus nepalensis]|uniref:hypothetical protein n=1 Tax=Muricoccus nepalensis TaxID=1854500 RepID=UPI00112628C5|nr:hypothetical protein [Roseomonas nepalensis]